MCFCFVPMTQRVQTRSVQWAATAHERSDNDPTPTPLTSDVINVRNYGAVGDGVADDTAAFTRAMAVELAHPTAGNVGGGTISMPRADYAIHGPLTFDRRMTHLVGDIGTRITSLDTSGRNVLELTHNSGTYNYSGLEDFTIQGSGADGNGIYVYAPFVRGRGLQVLGAGGFGLEIKGYNYAAFDGLIVDSCHGGGVWAHRDDAGAQPNDTTFLNTRVSNNDKYGWLFQSTTHMLVLGGDCEGNEQKAAEIDDCVSITFLHHYFEGNNRTSGTVSIDINDSQSVVFDSCRVAESQPVVFRGSTSTTVRNCYTTSHYEIAPRCTGTLFENNTVITQYWLKDESFKTTLRGNRISPDYQTFRGLGYPIQPQQVIWNVVGHNLVADSSCAAGTLLTGTGGLGIVQDTSTGWYDSRSTKIAWQAGDRPTISKGAHTGAFVVPTDSALAVSVSMKVSEPDAFQLFTHGTAPDCVNTVWVDTEWHRYVFLFERNAGGSETPSIWVLPAVVLSKSKDLYVDDLNVEVLPYSEAETRLDAPVYVVTGATAITDALPPCPASTPHSASHDYGAGTTAWTMNTLEAGATLFTVTNASGAADAVFPLAAAGKQFTVYNNSGQVITFKVSGQTGAATTNGKYSVWTMDATDCVKIYEQP